MNEKNKYGFLIISCKRNVPILNVTLDSLCSSLKEQVNIYVSFDEVFDYSPVVFDNAKQLIRGS